MNPASPIAAAELSSPIERGVFLVMGSTETLRADALARLDKLAARVEKHADFKHRLIFDINAECLSHSAEAYFAIGLLSPDETAGYNDRITAARAALDALRDAALARMRAALGIRSGA